MTWLLSLLGVGGIAVALIFIPGALPAAIQALGALISAIRRNPWQFALIASLCLSAWLYMGKRSETRRADAWHHAWQAQKNASDAAAAAQKALNAKIQSTYQEQADGAQERHIARDAGMRSATADFIRANRVQPGQCEAGASNPSPAASGAPVPQEPTASPVMVAVEQSDVETCAADYGYALSAYEWAKGLLDAGVAR